MIDGTQIWSKLFYWGRNVSSICSQPKTWRIRTKDFEGRLQAAVLSLEFFGRELVCPLGRTELSFQFKPVPIPSTFSNLQRWAILGRLGILRLMNSMYSGSLKDRKEAYVSKCWISIFISKYYWFYLNTNWKGLLLFCLPK